MTEVATDTVFLPPSLRRFHPVRVPRWEWNEHLALAYDLVEALRPRLLVGLGMHWGASYYACCQAVLENDLDTLCYAVSRWKEQRGTLGGNYLHDNFVAHGRDRYNSFAYVMRRGPARGLEHFSPESIDFVHLGEYFEGERLARNIAGQIDKWMHKLRPGGVFMVHDVGQPGSESRELWDELGQTHATFLMPGDPATGVLRKAGAAEEDDPELLRLLFGGNPGAHKLMQGIYNHAADYLVLEYLVGEDEFGRMRQDREAPDD